MSKNPHREETHRLAAKNLDKCTLCKVGAGMPCVTARMRVTAPHKQRRTAEQRAEGSCR